MKKLALLLAIMMVIGFVASADDAATTFKVTGEASTTLKIDLDAAAKTPQFSIVNSAASTITVDLIKRTNLKKTGKEEIYGEIKLDKLGFRLKGNDTVTYTKDGSNTNVLADDSQFNAPEITAKIFMGKFWLQIGKKPGTETNLALIKDATISKNRNIWEDKWTSEPYLNKTSVKPGQAIDGGILFGGVTGPVTFQVDLGVGTGANDTDATITENKFFYGVKGVFDVAPAKVTLKYSGSTKKDDSSGINFQADLDLGILKPVIAADVKLSTTTLYDVLIQVPVKMENKDSIALDILYTSDSLLGAQLVIVEDEAAGFVPNLKAKNTFQFKQTSTTASAFQNILELSYLLDKIKPFAGLTITSDTTNNTAYNAGVELKQIENVTVTVKYDKALTGTNGVITAEAKIAF
jgi:hypothetical protein